MAGENTPSTLNGFFKEIYSDHLKDLMPNQVKLCKMIPFSRPAEKLGLQYNQPVVLSTEHGVTYGGTEGDAFSYESPINGVTKNATVKGAEMVLRGQVSLAAISRSGSDAASFGRATKHVVKNLINSSFKKHETQCFYGGTGLGVVESVSTTEVVIAISEYAAGIWAGGENMRLNIKVQDTAADRMADVKVVSVDIENRKLVLAADAAAAGVVADDVIYEFGAYSKEFVGIHKMLTEKVNPIFGIPTDQYSLWSGNVSDAAGALTFAKISKAIAASVSKGLEGKLTLFINPKAWSDLLTEQTAQRTFHEGGMSEYSNGAESIKFHSQNGLIEIVASTFVKEGYAYGLDLAVFSRIGSSDVSFEVPGKPGQYVERLESANAIQLLTYSDVALFCEALGVNIVLTGIVNG